MSASSAPGFIGQKAWADRLGVSVRTFRRWRESGLIPLPDCVAPGNPRWSMELVNRTTLRRRNGAFQSHSARFVQGQGSAKGSRLSAKDELSACHAANDTESESARRLHSLEVTR